MALIKDRVTYWRSAPPILNNPTPLPACFGSNNIYFSFYRHSEIYPRQGGVCSFGFYEAKNRYSLPKTKKWINLMIIENRKLIGFYTKPTFW